MDLGVYDVGAYYYVASASECINKLNGHVYFVSFSGGPSFIDFMALYMQYTDCATEWNRTKFQ